MRDERWKYWNVIGTRDSLSVIRSSRGINASRRISIDVAYVTSYLNGDTRSWDGRRKIISNFSLTINCLLHSPSIEEETASSLERERKCSHVFLLGEIYYLEFFLVINLLPRDHWKKNVSCLGEIYFLAYIWALPEGTIISKIWHANIDIVRYDW